LTQDEERSSYFLSGYCSLSDWIASSSFVWQTSQGGSSFGAVVVVVGGMVGSSVGSSDVTGGASVVGGSVAA